MKLSPRLQTVVSFVEMGSRIADIGTDHGYVPIYLIENHIAASALAMDIRKGPLERAESHIRRYGLEDRIETRLSDGLKALAAGEADTVVVAGMGGELIIHILEEGRQVWETVRHWILSPQSEPQKVRKYLEENGFAIRDEAMLIDEGKYYTVISAAGPGAAGVSEHTGHGGCLTEAQCLYGPILIRKKDPVLKEYLEKEKQTLKSIGRQLESRDTEGAGKRLEEIRHGIAMIEEVEHEMR